MSRLVAVRIVLRAVVVVLIISAGIAGQVLLVRGQSDLAEVVVGGALVTLVGFVALGSVVRRVGGARSPELSIDRAADALGVAVQAQWQAAALERGLMNPVPIPVPWVWARPAVTGPVLDAVGSSASSARFPPISGTRRVDPGDVQAGRLADLFPIYAGLDSGRLILIGAGGFGKTGAAILLLLDALRHRERLSEAERWTAPVPVLLNCAGWNPCRLPFSAWLADQLRSTYRLLRAPEYGPAVADQLLATGRIAVFLDGFDEVDPALRPAVLGALNGQAKCRLVLLTRQTELVEAVQAGHLASAAALELLPVSNEDAAEYLARCRVRPASPAWQRLIEHVRAGADSVVANTLDSPLALTLVRDTFTLDDQVSELLVADRFSSRADVMGFLLDRVLPAAYSPRPGSPAPRYSLGEATRWFEYLAATMNRAAIRDLAWWRVPEWQPAAFRAVANGLLAALVFGALGSLAFGLGFGIAAFLFGGMAGVLVGAVAEGRNEDRPVQLGPIRWQALGSPRNGKLNMIALATGLGYGTVGGILFGLKGGAAFGITLGIAVALAFGFAVALSILIAQPSAEPGSPLDPMISWRRDRTAGIVIGAAFAVTFGVMSGTAFALRYGLHRGLAFGIAGGLLAGGAVALTLIRTWDSRLAFFQLWRAGYGPLLMMRFLDDARHRGVLRTVGPAYQFRHAELQDRLAARTP